MKEDGKDCGFLRKVDIVVHVLNEEETANFVDDGKIRHETESGARQQQMKQEVHVDG